MGMVSRNNPPARLPRPAAGELAMTSLTLPLFVFARGASPEAMWGRGPGTQVVKVTMARHQPVNRVLPRPATGGLAMTSLTLPLFVFARGASPEAIWGRGSETRVVRVLQLKDGTAPACQQSEMPQTPPWYENVILKEQSD